MFRVAPPQAAKKKMPGQFPNFGNWLAGGAVSEPMLETGWLAPDPRFPTLILLLYVTTLVVLPRAWILFNAAHGKLHDHESRRRGRPRTLQASPPPHAAPPLPAHRHHTPQSHVIVKRTAKPKQQVEVGTTIDVSTAVDASIKAQNAQRPCPSGPMCNEKF